MTRQLRHALFSCCGANRSATTIGAVATRSRRRCTGRTTSCGGRLTGTETLEQQLKVRNNLHFTKAEAMKLTAELNRRLK